MTATRTSCKSFGYGCPYPINEVIMRQNNINPEDDWPGTSWTEIGQGHVPIGANSSYGNGLSGEPTHQHLTSLGFDEGGHIYAYGNSSKQPVYASRVVKATYQGFGRSLLTFSANANIREAYTGSTPAIPPWFGVRFWRRTA